MYDLKTATRLYVLEGHTRAITALSFSPDGRRLVSVSLEESRVVVWKVGVGILSMFTPGAAPRQGSGGNATPFKTLDFAVGEEGEPPHWEIVRRGETADQTLGCSSHDHGGDTRVGRVRVADGAHDEAQDSRVGPHVCGVNALLS